MLASDRVLYKRLGFSLIELIVALFVLALLVTITATGLGWTDRNVSMRKQTAEIARSIATAQSEAIAKRKVASLLIDVENKTWTTAAGAEHPVDDSFALSFRTSNDEILSQSVARLTFYPDGSSSGGIIKLQRADETRAIEVDWMTGAISIKRGEDYH